jgi:sugar lactone lactonase YvrE
MDRFDGHTGALVDSLTLSDTNGASFIAFGSDGLLYVSEYWGGGVDVYDPNTGTFVKSLLSDWMDGPNGLVFDDKGELYVNSLFSNTIVKFSGDSGSLFTQGSPLSNPQDMVITSVPEPSTYALMLGGLVILSVIVRHRKGYKV